MFGFKAISAVDSIYLTYRSWRIKYQSSNIKIQIPSNSKYVLTENNHFECKLYTHILQCLAKIALLYNSTKI